MLSVIIPTWGRCQEVIDTVKGLSEQTVLPAEILVIDQNIPPFEILDQALRKFPLVRHIKSSTKGVLFNMNLGVQESKSEILLFVDDDIIPHKKLIEAHLNVYASDPEKQIGGVAGRVTQPSGDREPDSIKRVGRFSKWTGKTWASFNALKACDCDFAPGGNMSFRKSVLVAAGGFDLSFVGNAYHFEPDLGLRVKKSGYRLVFEPKAFVQHLMAPSGGVRIHDKALHTYYFIRNGTHLFMRHGNRIALPLFLTNQVLYCFLKSFKNLDPRIFTEGMRAVFKMEPGRIAK